MAFIATFLFLLQEIFEFGVREMHLHLDLCFSNLQFVQLEIFSA